MKNKKNNNNNFRLQMNGDVFLDLYHRHEE